VRRQASRLGPTLYTRLLWELAHLRFDDEAAQRHWAAIEAVRATAAQRLQHPVDLRVALVHYFLEHRRTLKNPTSSSCSSSTRLGSRRCATS